MIPDTWFPEVSGSSGPSAPGSGLERRLQQLQSLQHLSLLLSSTLDLQALLQALVRELWQTFGYARVHVALHREGLLVPLAIAGHDCALPPLTTQEGVSGFVFRTGEPAFLLDVCGNPYYVACNPDTVQEICVPLKVGGKVLGILNVEVGPEDAPLTEDDLAFLQSVGQQAALAVENALLYQQQVRMAQRLKAIGETAREFIALDETQPFPMRATRRIREALGCYSVSLFLLREGQLEWVAGAGGFVGGELPYGARIPLGKGIVTHVFETGKPWLARDVARDLYFLFFELLPEARAEIAVPLYAGGKVVGVLDLQDDEVGAFDEGDVEALEILAGQLAAALENDRLFAQVVRAKREWEETFDALTDALFLLSPAGRVLRCNWAAARLVGLEPRHLVGRTCHEVLCKRDAPSSQCPLQETLRSGQGVSVERQFPQFGDRHFHITTAPRAEEGGQVFQVILVLRDVTQEHRLRQQLLQAEKLAAVGQLVSGMAHELNNPLTSVLGYAQLLQMRGDLPADDREDLQHIAAAARRASHIVHSLQTFAQGQRVERQPVQVNALVQRILELQAPQLQADRIEVVTDLAEELPEVLADPYRLQQVLLHLITNAREAMAEARGRGTLTVRTQVEGDHLLISVADDGPGIPPEHLGRVFEPFFTTKEVGQGTGLGLSICYGIVTEHGGHIWAESEPGRGATFYVELPLGREAVLVPEGQGPRPILPLRRGRILVVEDDPDIRTLLDRSLSPLGHQVDLAETAEEALARLEQGRYDAIFWGTEVPGVEGRELYQWLCARDPGAARRVVFLTEGEVSPEMAGFLREVAVPRLEKPFRLEQVMRALHAVLRGDVRASDQGWARADGEEGAGAPG
ncbi:MAG: hybrid sensor histidine kinase/response regulator [Anaerolineae bacterium]